MKTFLLRFFKALALLTPVAALMLFAQNSLFYHRDHNNDRVHAFYKEPVNSLDVVVLGASDVYAGYSPVYAYEYSGLTSGIYAYDSNPGSLYLPQLKEILHRQDPRLVVVEINGFLHGDGQMNKESSLRYYTESAPLSLVKLRAIQKHTYQDKISCLIPFFKYHDQWTRPFAELKAQFDNRWRADDKPARLKGVYTQTAFHDIPSAYDVADDNTSADLHPSAHQYLMDFLQYCQDQNIRNLLFVRFPHKIMGDTQYERFARSNRAEEIVSSFGYPFLDLESGAEDMGIDQQYDFYNEEHLSLYGQMRLTEYLCDLWLDEYALSPMEQTAENEQRWLQSIDYLHAYHEAVQQRLDEGIEEELYESPLFLQELEQRICRVL